MTTWPWSPIEVVRLAAGNLIALIMLGVGWALVERGTDLSSQVAWLNLSIAGLLVALWVNVRWLLDGRRSVGVRLHRIAGIPTDRSQDSAPPESSPLETTGAYVAGDGLVRFHRDTCPLARGKEWEAATPAAHRKAGRAPCGVCRP